MQEESPRFFLHVFLHVFLHDDEITVKFLAIIFLAAPLLLPLQGALW
jgi:hypothetical protein